MKKDWFFNEELSPSDVLVDKFKDSKFETSKWPSFAREIIQNSLDARDDKTKPVRVVFDLNKNLSLADIPGGEGTLEILSRCVQAASNKQTKSAYEKGVSILTREKVYCLKISDYNTVGVRSGRDAAWGALVYDEGVSVKQRPGSAGSHGVGKKVPYIVSGCNTVFYATKNKYFDDQGIFHSDKLVQGKTTLINWVDGDGIRRSSSGWFGKIDETTTDAKKKVQPLLNDEVDDFPDYFKRTDDFGTDVIIIGTNLYEQERDTKGFIISAILENFFIAFKRNILEVEVFGETINQSTFNSVFSEWYVPNDSLMTPLEDMLQTINQEPQVLDVKNKKGEKLGEIKLYFSLGNSRNKKYYSIVRSHGMRIKEHLTRFVDQPYTGVAVTDGDELNRLLSSLENAAHDDFIAYDENMDVPEDAVEAYEQMQKLLRDFIYAAAKIDEGKSQEIEGLSNIISIPGMSAEISKKNTLPKLKKNPVHKRTPKTAPDESHDNGEYDHNGRGKGHRHIPGAKEGGGKTRAVLVLNYLIPPVFIKCKDGFLLKFQTENTITNATIRISSINSEDKGDKSIVDILDGAIINNKRYPVTDGKIKNIDISSEQVTELKLVLKRDVVYQLSAELSYEEVVDDE